MSDTPKKPPRAGLPMPSIKAKGYVLAPGQPGYEEALARIRARQAQQTPKKEKPT